MNTIEIECRFLEIDKAGLLKKLMALGAKDLGETMLEEVIIYDKDLTWSRNERFIRLRKKAGKTVLSYKEHREASVDGTYEIEFGVDDYDKAIMVFEHIGLVAARRQQKLRHTLELGGVTFDIDTWPRIPAYVELEGESEAALKKAAEAVGYDWKDAEFHNASWVIENKYGIPIRKMKWFTFERFE